ncbi:MAG TPA: SpoIID/LytB domain-containing protein [Actinomycetota bacterium]|nr:SpoIID/LytB domain-containing protein [Actinomycetota bacterium]
MSSRLVAVALAVVCVLGAAPAAEARRTPGALAGPVRLVPRAGETLHVSELHRYFGTVELSAASDGLVVMNRLSLERYLLGLNEVPPGWPDEALKAQAVAARTYALWTLSRPRAGAAATYGFDICATVECQVFAGADVVATPDGRRWAAAVAATEDEAVLYEGEPILARYHSTSGGQTLDNSQAFPGDPDYLYLQGVPSRTEQGSPLYRWQVRFPLPHLRAMLAGIWTPAHGMLRRVHTVPSSEGLHYPDVILTGSKRNLRLDAETLRDIVRTKGPELYPGSYPSLWPTTSGRLPETLPANRITIRTVKDLAVVTGRGWGHGTGMSQWGAHGLAERGSTYEEILAHYYRGTAVGAVPARRSITVGVDWGRSAVTVTGAFDVVDGNGDLAVRDALGSWTFTPAGDGAVAVQPPPGDALPLRVGFVRTPKKVSAGERVPIEFALSKAARLWVQHPGATVGGARVRRPGKGTVVWKAPEEPGRYEVALVASAGRGEADRRSVGIRVVADRKVGPPLAPDDDGGTGAGLARLAVGVLLMGLVVVALGSRIRS